MRFSVLQTCLPTSGRREALLRFYEATKQLESTRRNPLFWLQYAIACTVLKEWTRGATYFANAYAFGQRIHSYDTKQIDNHYARFLLARAADSASYAEPMVAFREAKKLIFHQLRSEGKLHYPYRPARLFLDFYQVHEKRLTVPERAEVIEAGSRVLDVIAKLHASSRTHPDVRRCVEAMQTLVEAAAV
jgi:hypothetical protein